MSDVMEKLVSLCKRKGFIFQSSEIYGGLNGCWDYGPLGVELLRNIKESWWRSMTYREDVEGIDASILMHAKVWEASGHVEGFNDPMVEDSKTNERFRLDHLLEEAGVECTDLTFDDMAAKVAELGLKSPKAPTRMRQIPLIVKREVARPHKENHFGQCSSYWGL